MITVTRVPAMLKISVDTGEELFLEEEQGRQLLEQLNRIYSPRYIPCSGTRTTSIEVKG